MAGYSVKKTSNGEFKEIEKKLKLNVTKYITEPTTLYFDVEGQELPFLIDYNLFFNILLEQTEKGLIETLTYDKGILSTTVRDGNKIKKWVCDFNLDGFNLSIHSNHHDNLERSILKIVSLYRENPNNYISTEQKYMWLIYDILDGDRMPIIENEDELRRIFEVYNLHKDEFLDSLLENVVFYDDDGNIIEYRGRLREKKLDLIRYDLFNQMEVAILLFAHNNNADKLYQDYLESIYIPRREVVYKYYDENGNEIETAPEIEGGTIFSLSREAIEQKLSDLKELASNGIQRLLKRNKKENN